MKKTIQKPENWQDFESLSKKLWGEVWGIPMKIKKNGRNGQPQAGVDVYGVPNGESSYWGIQCKGKDDYTNAKLTKTEIDREIENAKKFKPALAVFIFATTMNKDVELEEYVRLKDQESRATGGFEILLYCWEDIADLIDEHRDTYNYYVNNQQHKSKFDFKVYLNDFLTEKIIKPKCIKTIKRYRLKEPDSELTLLMKDFANGSTKLPGIMFDSKRLQRLTEGRINYAICSFELIMANEGSVVIEDWRVSFKFDGPHQEVLDQVGSGHMGMIDLNYLKNKNTYVKKDTIHFTPRNNEPLIQKDNRYFKAYVIPGCLEYTLPIQWEILARDYNATGTVNLIVKPIYEEVFEYEYVDTDAELKPDEIISIKTKKNYDDEEDSINSGEEEE